MEYSTIQTLTWHEKKKIYRKRELRKVIGLIIMKKFWTLTILYHI